MTDLSTSYLGLKLRTPLVASSSPLCKDLERLRRIEEAGAAAVVLHSLFEAEEQVSLESPPKYEGHNSYLQHLTHAKKELQIPVIGSLNGVTSGGWIRYAREIQEAGADAIELNIYFIPASLDTNAAEIERSYCELVHDVKSRVRIPVAVKLGPYFTSMGNFARQLDVAGADALVFFNRFYQPDFDLEEVEVTPNLTLSTSDELRLRLHWVALLANRVRPELAITGGVHTGEDAVKGIMAGAKVVMLTSALLLHGIPHLHRVEKDFAGWMADHEYESVQQMRGSMNVDSVAELAVFHRANYLKVLGSYTLKAQR